MFWLSACSTDDSAAPTAEGVPWSDVAPILESNCSSCHQSGAIAAFLPITTAAEAAGARERIAAAVQSGAMPPWPADPSCADYEGDLRLSDAEIATIVGWAEGTDEGEGELAPPQAASQLSRVDFSMGPEAPYTPTIEPDDYRCFLFDWPAGSTFMTGYDVDIDNAEVVHHVVVYKAPGELRAEFEALDEADEGAGYTCYGGPGLVDDASAEWLGAWAPGGVSGDLPEGTGVWVEEGEVVILQMHYNTSAAGPQPDQSQVSFKVDDSVDHPGVIQPWADPSWLGSERMEIPAGSSATHDFSYTFGDDYLVWTAALHMHTLGERAELRIDRGDGSEACMLRIEDWDFHWQRTYRFTEAKPIADGDAVSVECSWDNPGEEAVYWGEGTGDEMCLGTFLITLP